MFTAGGLWGQRGQVLVAGEEPVPGDFLEEAALGWLVTGRQAGAAGAGVAVTWSEARGAPLLWGWVGDQVGAVWCQSRGPLWLSTGRRLASRSQHRRKATAGVWSWSGTDILGQGPGQGSIKSARRSRSLRPWVSPAPGSPDLESGPGSQEAGRRQLLHAAPGGPSSSASSSPDYLGSLTSSSTAPSCRRASRTVWWSRSGRAL